MVKKSTPKKTTTKKEVEKPTYVSKLSSDMAECLAEAEEYEKSKKKS